MSITKREIVDRIYKDTKIRYIDVRRVVQEVFDRIVDYLGDGERIEIRNFGIFKIKSRRARKGRNPRTGQEVMVPPRKAVVFKPGMIMKKKAA